MASFLRFLQNVGLLLARLGLGGILLLHGWMRWNAGVQKQIDYLTQFRTPYAEVAAWGSIVFEFVGGALLIVGALTRLVGLGVLIEQILIIAYTSWYKWPPTLLNADGSYKGVTNTTWPSACSVCCCSSWAVAPSPSTACSDGRGRRLRRKGRARGALHYGRSYVI